MSPNKNTGNTRNTRGRMPASQPKERRGCLAAIVGLGAVFGGLSWLFHREAPEPTGLDPVSLDAGYEVRDADLRKMIRVMIALVVGVGVVVAVATGFETLVTGRFGLFPFGTTIVVQPGNVQPPPAPRLESGNGQVLEELHANEDKLLNNYTWIDQGAGTVRIPINRAIDLILQHGLPTTPGGAQAGSGTLTAPAYSSSGRMPVPQLP